MRSKNSDTLEEIVQEAIEREKRINAEHPERHGYGMVKGEADDLIKRLHKLAVKEELAQRGKVIRRNQRVRMCNNDQLYSRSPEDIALRNIYREKINRAEKRVMDNLNIRSKQIFELRDQGEKLTDISKIIGLHISNVSRDYSKTIEKLKEEFKNTL